jgi:hypothetical protein
LLTPKPAEEFAQPRALRPMATEIEKKVLQRINHLFH